MVSILLEVCDNVKVKVKAGRVSFWFDGWLSGGSLHVGREDIVNPMLQVKEWG